MVVVFRRESVHEWSAIDKLRLRLLLTNSIVPLILCMIGLLLLTIAPESPSIWRSWSGLAFAISLLFAVTMTKTFRRVGSATLDRERGTRFIFYFFATAGLAANLLQLYNAVLLDVFWPFFTGIVVQLITATFQFARMILLQPE